MITLYDYWRSSACYRVRIALNLLGLEYRTEFVNLLDAAHKAPQNLARNKQGLVPTLEIDGKTFTQSIAIIEYLNETRGGDFLPEDAEGKARVRALSYAIAMEIHPVCNLSVSKFAVENSGGTMEMKDWMQAFIPSRMAAFEAMLDDPATGHFCHGDTPTMADICLVPQAFNAARWEIDLGPETSRILGALHELPAVQKAHPDHFKP